VSNADIDTHVDSDSFLGAHDYACAAYRHNTANHYSALTGYSSAKHSEQSCNSA